MRTKQAIGWGVIVLIFPLIVIELAYRACRYRVRLVCAYLKELNYGEHN